VPPSSPLSLWERRVGLSHQATLRRFGSRFRQQSTFGCLESRCGEAFRKVRLKNSLVLVSLQRVDVLVAVFFAASAHPNPDEEILVFRVILVGELLADRVLSR
jgi:hypothetical protein